ncbi:MAG: hypothetical protein HZB33_02995 [Nitrospirae bacterium]|nr:hypothetical protein [Nitrospirota bacterium]
MQKTNKSELVRYLSQVIGDRVLCGFAAVLMILGMLFFAEPAQGEIAYIPWLDGTNYDNATDNEILAVDIANGVILKRIHVGNNPRGEPFQ